MPAQILSGAFASCEALRTEQPANAPVARDSQRCRGSEATSTTIKLSGAATDLAASAPPSFFASTQAPGSTITSSSF